MAKIGEESALLLTIFLTEFPAFFLSISSALFIYLTSHFCANQVTSQHKHPALIPYVNLK